MEVCLLSHLLLSYGLGAVYLWWLTAPMSSAASLATAIPLFAVTALLFWLMWRRACRLRSEWESLAPRLVTHGGFGAGGSRWDRRSGARGAPEDFETHVGGGW